MGDIHASTFDLRRAMEYAAEQEVERVFFLGDFGWTFEPKFIGVADKVFEATGLYVDFIDGNHDNFDFILSHDVAEDGYRYISKSIRHIPRGTILDLDGAKVLCMGGAVSVDRIWRKPGISWWHQENIKDEDMVRAGQELIKVGGQVDAVFSHDGPVLPKGTNKDTFELMRAFKNIAYDLKLSYVNMQKLNALMGVAMPRFWYHGHHHTRWTTAVETWYGECVVEALDRDGTKLGHAMKIVYTEDWSTWEIENLFALTSSDHPAGSSTETEDINGNA